ncbi:MAG: arylesterase [Gemmatimonadaceae bacterium]
MKKYVLTLLALSAAAGGCSGSAGDARETPESAANPPVNAQPNAAAAAIDSSATPAEARHPRIIFAGTSLTAGMGLDPDSAYPLHVQRMIDSARLDYRVVNAGVSGETSSALLGRLDWLLREPFSVFVIETGANDGLRGIPVTTMRNNIARIVDRVRAERPDARVVLLQMEALPNMGAVYTREFRDAFGEVAREKDVPLLPFLLDGVAGNRELNQGDGIHPNYEGSRIVAANVWRGLRPLLR